MTIGRESLLPLPAATTGQVYLLSAALGAQAATVIDYRFEGGPVGTVIPSLVAGGPKQLNRRLAGAAKCQTPGLEGGSAARSFRADGNVDDIARKIGAGNDDSTSASLRSDFDRDLDNMRVTHLPAVPEPTTSMPTPAGLGAARSRRFRHRISLRRCFMTNRCQARATHNPRATAVAVAAVAALAVAIPAAADIVTWTANAPVYLVKWDEGNGLQSHEYRLFSEWNASCQKQQNTDHGAICLATTYWDSNANWDRLLQPGLNDDARIDDSNLPGPAYVWISHYNSDFQGQIGGAAVAGTLYANTTILLADSLHLSSNSYIRDLAFGASATLRNDGNLDIGGLNAMPGAVRTEGRFQGGGTTTIGKITSGWFNPSLEGGQTIVYTGSGGAYSGLVEMWLSDQSRFVNRGTLDATALAAVIHAAGAFNPYSQSTFANADSGTLRGPFTMDGVRFDNDGVVTIDHGVFDAGFNGTHRGSFAAGVGATLWFGGFGAVGHHFLPGSSVDADGQVVFNGTSHRVEGYYRAADTQIGAPYAQVTFTGSLGPLGKVTVNPSSWVSFDHTAGVSFGDLVINGPQAFAYLTTAGPSTAQRLTIAGTNQLDAGLNTSNALTVSDRFDWGAGALYGPVTVNGTTTLGAGKRTLAGTLRNAGTLSWNDGLFTTWSGRVENQAGALFDIHGDFAYGDGTGGSFDNAGTLRKSAGGGFTILPVALDNRGTVQALAGTLGLYGGGRHTGQFSAAPGARIVLGGDNLIAGAVTTSGAVDVVASGGFTILAGGSYTHAAGNSMSVGRLTIAAGGRFDNNGWFGIGDWNHPAQVSNQGTLTNRGSFGAVALDNSGTLSNAIGADLTVYGTIGGPAANSGQIDNAGTLTLYQVGNSGRIANTGTMQLSGLTHSGSLDNRGALSIDGRIAAGGRIDNGGAITAFGELTIDAGGQIRGNGTFAGSATTVNGVLEATGGISIDGFLKGSGTIIGNLTLGQFAQWLPGNSPGTMTVQGDVEIPLMSPAGLGWPGYDNTPGNIVIEVASTSVYDRLQISGNVSLNALVDLVLLPGYTPTDGDTFQWLSAGSVSGFAVPRVFGLSNDWHADPVIDPTGRTMGFALTNEPVADWTAQIAFSGAVAVPPGAIASNWSHGGIDRLDNAGWFINQPGATLYVTEVVNQPGGVIANHGSFQVASSFDNGGELRIKSGADLTVIGVFTNTGRLINSGTLNVGQYYSWGSGLTNAAGGRIDNHGTINRDYYAQIVNRGTFTVDGTISNEFGYLYNAGTIRNEGGTFVVLPGGVVSGSGSYLHITNPDNGQDATTQVDGRLAAAQIWLYGGTLSGSGTLAGAVQLTSVIVHPGHSPGTLTIEGDLTANLTFFEIELAGVGSADRVHVTGRAAFGPGTVRFDLVDGYQPHAGDSFVWLVADGGATGLANLHWEATDGIYAWNDAYPMPGIRVNFSGDRISFTDVSAVPELQSWAMWLGGLAALSGFLAQRRRRDDIVASI